MDSIICVKNGSKGAFYDANSPWERGFSIANGKNKGIAVLSANKTPEVCTRAPFLFSSFWLTHQLTCFISLGKHLKFKEGRRLSNLLMAFLRPTWWRPFFCSTHNCHLVLNSLMANDLHGSWQIFCSTTTWKMSFLLAYQRISDPDICIASGRTDLVDCGHR